MKHEAYILLVVHRPFGDQRVCSRSFMGLFTSFRSTTGSRTNDNANIAITMMTSSDVVVTSLVVDAGTG